MADDDSTTSMPEPTNTASVRVLGSLGLAVLLLLIYPALSLSYTWLTRATEHSIASSKYRMDIEHANLGELLLIPGFGETLANRWLQERDALVAKYHDPLIAIEKMKGIGPAKLKVIREYAVARQSPVGQGDASKSSPESP